MVLLVDWSSSKAVSVSGDRSVNISDSACVFWCATNSDVSFVLKVQWKQQNTLGIASGFGRCLLLHAGPGLSYDETGLVGVDGASTFGRSLMDGLGSKSPSVSSRNILMGSPGCLCRI